MAYEKVKTCPECGHEQSIIEFIYMTEKNEPVVVHSECYACFRKKLFGSKKEVENDWDIST